MSESGIRVEPISDEPKFLQLGLVRLSGQGAAFEIVSRHKLDTRAIVPWFEKDGELHVGICERRRAARALHGASMRGWEALSFDFRGADETGDISALTESLFAERTGLVPDPTRAPIALPSFARSIGYLCELCLPLLLPIRRPELPGNFLELREPAGATLLFMPLREALARLRDPSTPLHAEELEVMLRALLPPRARPAMIERDPSVESARLLVREHDHAPGDKLLEEKRAHVVTAERLQPDAVPAAALHAERSAGPLRGDSFRFLRLTRIANGAELVEAVTPASGVSFALLPFVRTSHGAHFLLWDELRPSAIERQARAPLFDLPVSLHHVNATAFFLSEDDAALVKRGELEHLEGLAPGLVARALGVPVPVRSYELLGSPCSPAPAISSELRVAAAIELDAAALLGQRLSPDALLISARELSRAIGEGRVRDPVVVRALLQLADSLSEPGRPPLDPFAAARAGEPAARRRFLAAMTSGSEVERRLLGYSSIESEQLAAPSYARLMTLLQHEHGLRIAYPKSESDRTFFKAAFRVFMAAERGDEDRALQGLHWSHDAFHFALGNFVVPPPPDFAAWFVSGKEAPLASIDQPPEGPAWDAYARALKTAENEATFFSFWTLYAENLALARHVGKLTYYEALRDLGITDRPTARAIYDDVVDRAVLPELVKRNPVFAARDDIRSLFDYMLGFRAYHYKDIAAAWRYATRDPYRGYLARFAIYERDLGRYIANVRGFCARLAVQPRGLNPILCALADARLDLNLRVWDVTKALRLLRSGSLAKGAAGESLRAELLEEAEPPLSKLEDLQRELQALRVLVEDAELTRRNESTLARTAQLAEAIETVRQEIWDWVARSGLVAAEKIAEERVRELPR